MGASRKAKTHYNADIAKENYSDMFNSVRKAKGMDTAETETQPADTASDTGVKNAKITLLVKPHTQKAWKQFCLEHDITLTAAIKRAMAHLIDGVKNGSVEI